MPKKIDFQPIDFEPESIDFQEQPPPESIDSMKVISSPRESLKYVYGTAKNIPDSAINYFKNMIKGVSSIPGMVEKTFNKTPQQLVADMDKPGIPEAILNSLQERYGGLDKALTTLHQDPVGVLGDISVIYGKVDPTRAITTPLKTGAKVLTETLPKWAYKSAVKMGTGKTLSIAERDKRAMTGLDEMIMPTEGGLNRLNEKIGGIENAIQTPVNEAAQRGVKIPREAVANRLSETVDKFSNQVNPLADIDAIANVERGFVTTQPARIPIDVAQNLKKGTYQQLKGKYGQVRGAEIEAEKTLARGLKEEVYSALEATHPELKALGEKEGAMVALRDSIESAVKRIQNQEAVGLGMGAGAAGGYAIAGPTGATVGMIERIMELPRIKSATAIALFKAGQKAKKYGGETARLAGKLPPYAYGIGRYTQEDE